MLIYWCDAKNLNNFIAKFCVFTEGGRRKSRANATRVKAISDVCSTFGVQNLNPQQEKTVAEFLSGSNVFVNLPTGYGKPLVYHMAPLLVAIELSKQHSHFSNKSIVVCKIYLEKSLNPCSSSRVKKHDFTFDMYS